MAAAVGFTPKLLVSDVGKVLVPLALPVLQASQWPWQADDAIEVGVGESGATPGISFMNEMRYHCVDPVFQKAVP
jgi:hypothetical protein